MRKPLWAIKVPVGGVLLIVGFLVCHFVFHFYCESVWCNSIKSGLSNAQICNVYMQSKFISKPYERDTFGGFVDFCFSAFWYSASRFVDVFTRNRINYGSSQSFAMVGMWCHVGPSLYAPNVQHNHVHGAYRWHQQLPRWFDYVVAIAHFRPGLFFRSDARTITLNYQVTSIKQILIKMVRMFDYTLVSL